MFLCSLIRLYLAICLILYVILLNTIIMLWSSCFSTATDISISPFVFQVNDGFPFSIALSWKPDAQNNEAQQTVVFPKGNTLPSVKALTFYRSSTFTVDVVNVDMNDAQVLQKISTYTVSNILKASWMVIMIV
jgi:hypothetical protein